MKVRCINIYNEQMKKYQDKSSWITIGKEYIVLEIEVWQGQTWYVIASDSNQQPILQNALQFEVISGKIPSSWEVALSSGKEFFIIGPKAWHDPDFWENCQNHEPKAMEIYKCETRIIYEEEGVL